MEIQTTDLEKFDKSLSGLFMLLKTIIKTHEKHKLNLSSRRNPILARLEKYIKIYDWTKPEEHLWYFQKIFSKNHPAILRGPDRDNWLRNGNIMLHFGEETGRPIKDAKVHLSLIYNTAIKLRDDIEETLQGLPDVEQSQELLYPGIFLLHLYRIFYELSTKEEEQDKLLGYIRDLENDAGIKKKEKRKSKSEDGNVLDGLVDVATGFMKQMGVTLPEGQNLPSGNELNEALNGVMKNPQAKSFLGDMMKEMKECDNFGDVVGKLLNKLPTGMDAATKETINKNVRNATNALTGNDDGNDDGNGNEDEYGDDEYGEEKGGEDEFIDEYVDEYIDGDDEYIDE